MRYLRAVQIRERIRQKFSQPKPNLSPAPTVRARREAFAEVAHRRPSMTAPTRFVFLNEERDLETHGWDDSGIALLWRYNLHYFDDLCAHGSAARDVWHRALIGRWLRENPPPRCKTAWAPYPTSIRIVNWIKWILAGNEPVSGMLESLAVQARWLEQRLERHLMGNHLFVNAKALVFVGCFFDGPEAARWRATGLAILREEIFEQILPDGAQFERSPMYHALAVEDMLDLVNVARVYPGVISAGDVRLIEERIPLMRRYLAAMCHPDGEVSFFNDSAIGIAPSPTELHRYAERLGYATELSVVAPLREGVTHFVDAGFIRVAMGRMVAILDVGPIGPDYLPGHAHADTLSMELSLDGHRLIVNSGTGEYGTGPERQRQRGTPAHSTLAIDGADSSEVWAGFRCARRARPFDLRIVNEGSRVEVTCSHDGYCRLSGAPVHTRTWAFDLSGVTIGDSVRGDPAVSHVCAAHFHTPAAATVIDRTTIALGPASSVLADSSHPSSQGPMHSAAQAEVLRDTAILGIARLSCRGASFSLEPTSFHPEFGLVRYQTKVVALLEDRSSFVRLDW